MNKVTTYNITIYTIAAILVIVTSPFILGLFVAKALDVTCGYVMGKAAENHLSRSLIRKRDMIIWHQKNDPKEAEVE